MDTLSDNRLHAYRDLVYGIDGFRTFFRQMTPISEIVAQHAVPPRQPQEERRDRGPARDPRVHKARVMLPGWYGVGQRWRGSRTAAC